MSRKILVEMWVFDSTLPSSKLDVGGDGKFTGVVTATSFSGSGANLTSLPAGQLTGTLPNATFPATLPQLVEQT